MAVGVSLVRMPISMADDRDAQAPATRDAEAVAAVLRGETVSYRELVERYQRLVYAVTWSCLGDATLAEDAAQEAFIRAYCSLPLLGNGAKFSAWVTTIARNTAISLGLKQRRELKNRARWALEQPASEPPAATAEEACPPELLRQALTELSAEHRESLVLFYLDGKRGAEAAAALGISEAALRMRLLRARAALRERLEARLGESLAQLQPRQSLTPGVMGVVLSTSTTKAGGGATAGTALLAALGKVLPFKIVVLFVPIVAVWGVAGAWSARRNMQWWARNFRDPEEAHAKYLLNLIPQASWLELFWANARLPIFVGVVWLALETIGDRMGGLFLAAIFLVLLVKMLRLSSINRRKDVHATIVLLLLVFIVLLPTAFNGGQTLSWNIRLYLAWLVAFLIMERVRPYSADSNLFVFEQAGLLPVSGDGAVMGKVAERLSSAQLFAFARFLGEQDMVDDYRWARPGEELMLKAGPLPKSLLLTPVNFLWPTLCWRQWNWIGLKADGTVSAHCSEDGARQAGEEAGREIQDIGAVEQRVASAVAAAWRDFRAGNIDQAEQALFGNVRVEDVLRELPAPGLTRVGCLRAVALGVAIFMVGLLGVVLVASSTDTILPAFAMFKLSGMLLGVLLVLMALAATLNQVLKE